MAKNAVQIVKLDKPLPREKGYLYFVNGAVKGTIDGIYRTKMARGKKVE